MDGHSRHLYFLNFNGNFYSFISPYCCVPHKYRVLASLVDENNDNIISEQEITNAIAILDKAKKNKDRKQQLNTFTLFGNYMTDSYTTTH